MAIKTRRDLSWLADRAGPTEATLVTGAILVGFVIFDLLTRRLRDLPLADVDTSFLLPAALLARPATTFLLIAAGAGLIWRYGSRLLVRWNELEHGARLQPVVGLLMAVAVWRPLTSARNYLFDEWYTADRLMLLAFFALALFRPAAIALVALQLRVMQAPLRAPSFPSPGLNIDELVVLVILILAVAVLVAVIRNSNQTVFALPIIAGAIGAQFFLPGRTKIRARWWDNEISNLPESGYHQGWLGDGDGEFARSLADAMDSVEPALVLLTLAFEVGAILMVFKRPLLILWMLAAIGFHVAVLASLGFVFFEFVVVEVAVLVLVAGVAGARWSRPAFALGPAAVGAIAVVLGPVLFDPPTLVWFDTPLTYAYEIDGVDADEQRYELDADDFAPYDDLFAFSDLGFGPTTPLVGAYGAASRSARDVISRFDGLTDVEDFEEPMATEPDADRVRLLQQFLLSTERGQGERDWMISPPDHFLLSREGPTYDFDVPLERLIVERVTTFRTDEGPLTRREAVLEVEIVDGEAVVTPAR